MDDFRSRGTGAYAWAINPALKERVDDRSMLKNVWLGQHIIVGLGNPVQIERRELVRGVEFRDGDVTHIVTQVNGTRREYVWHKNWDEDDEGAWYEAERAYDNALALIWPCQIRPDEAVPNNVIPFPLAPED